MPCEGIISADFLYDCDNGSIGGLETDIVLINAADLDRTAITYDAANKMVMTNMQLLATKKGYLFQGVKNVNSTAFELVKKDTGADKYKHTFNGTILTLSSENKLQLQLMSEGGKYVAIVNKKWKGASQKDAFEVYGIDSGLELNVVTYNSNENDGAAIIELSSVDSYEEPKAPVNLLETDYATTKTAFDNKFIQP